jgi:hypothetical protein
MKKFCICAFFYILMISANVYADAFETCDIKPVRGAIQGLKPIKKEEGLWIYPYKKSIMGIPAKAIGLGVCDNSGNDECGLGGYAVVFSDLPIKTARQLLLKKYKVDFTIEKRDENVGGTERPILEKDNFGIGKSTLVCDPGSV